jgi:sterol 14-demethylase
VAHKRVTFLIGPEVAPHFFKAGDDEMSQSEVRLLTHSQSKTNTTYSTVPLTLSWWPIFLNGTSPDSRAFSVPAQVYDFNVPTFGRGVVFDVDQKVRTEQFRMFTEALTKNRLKAYVPQFNKEAEVRRTALAIAPQVVGSANSRQTWHGMFAG